MTAHSFILADLFNVQAMSLDVPEHLLESEPDLELVPCPDCDGEGWVFSEGSAWQDAARLFLREDLCWSLRPCPRCHGDREVLDVLEPLPEATAAPECDRCQDSGWIDAEHTDKTRAAGFHYLLGKGVCPCGAWREQCVERAAA